MSFLSKERSQPRKRFGRALAAALLAQPAAFTAPAFAQTATPDTAIRWETVGEHPFAQSMTEALDDAHLERVFATAVQEGQLTQNDHDAFVRAATAQRANLGSTVDVRPGTKFPWVTDQRDPATGAGPADVEWAGQVDLRVRTVPVTRTDGRVVRFGIVVETMDGRPCYNWLVLPDAPAPTEPLPARHIEAPCPEPMHVTVDGLPAGDQAVTVIYAIDMNARNIPQVRSETCPAASPEEICRGCTEHVATVSTAETAQRLNRRLGILEAQTLQVQDRRLRIDLRSTFPIRLRDGSVATINLDEAIRQGIVTVILSCPRNANRGDSRDNAHGYYLEASDWAQNATQGQNGEATVSLRYSNGEYHINQPARQ